MPSHLLLLFTALLCVKGINSVQAVSNRESKIGSESCPAKEGCPTTDEQDNPNPPLTPENEENISDLAEVPGTAWWDLLSKAKTELARVTRTLHDTLNTITVKFAEIVRQIMNEELYDIIAVMLAKVGYYMFKPGEALYEVFEAVLSVILLLFCFVCSYVFLKLFPILFVFVFLSTMFLLHYFLGPMLIFKGLYFVAKHFLGVSWIIAKHPYITSAFIVTFILIGFVYSIVMTFKMWSNQRKERHRREKLYSDVGELREKVETLEKNQEEMLTILKELKETTNT